MNKSALNFESEKVTRTQFHFVFDMFSIQKTYIRGDLFERVPCMQLKANGDDDPVDIVEIGSAPIARGSVIQVC